MHYQYVLAPGFGPTGCLWIDVHIKFSPGIFSKTNSDASNNRTWLQQITARLNFGANTGKVQGGRRSVFQSAQHQRKGIWQGTSGYLLKPEWSCRVNGRPGEGKLEH